MVSLRKLRNVPEFKSTTSSTVENSLGCAESGIAINKCALQNDKITGSELLKSKQTKQLNETEMDNFPSDSGEKKSTSEKIKLQLFPLDNVACRCLELEKHNPYLELVIGTQKRISSVLKHLNQKWGKPKMTSGELMLFPSDVQLNSLRSCKRWTINDSNITATDVYIAVGSPAIFRLRYGWFSDIEIRASDAPLIDLQFKKHPWSNENERGNLIDIQQSQNPPIPTADTKHVPAISELSVNQNACNELDDTYNKDKQRITNSSGMQWDLSNISFGVFLSELSRNASMRQYTCDSFDAAIAQFKTSASADPVLRTSIFDAEDTCTPFSIQKTASNGIVSAETQDIHSGLLNSQGEKMFSQIDLQAPTHSEGSLIKKLDLNMMDSFGYLENDQPSSKELNSGDNICFGGLTGNSQISDASQYFRCSNMDS